MPDDEIFPQLTTEDLVRILRDMPTECDFCDREVWPQDLEPLSGDQWACHTCLDRWAKEDKP